MKKIFTFIFAALMSASMFASPAAVPTVQDVAAAGFDVTNARVICLYFDEQVCNDIVWVGTYNNWATYDPTSMLHFEPLEGFEGWYVVEVVDESETVQGKPVQLKMDGSFAWDFQSGDVEAWINMAQPGTQTGSFEPGYDGEADCTWPENGAYIYELAYWKKHNTPCVDKPKHDYTITVYMPEFCDEIANYADSVFIMGGFDWNEGIKMEQKVDYDFNTYYYVELDGQEEGTEYKFRCGTMGWDIQPQLNGVDLANMTMDVMTDVVLHFDGEGYGFRACAEYKYTEYENWQIRYAPNWEWSNNMTKVADGLYTINIIWPAYTELYGFNIKSDDNPIKQDWYALDDPAVTVADGLVEGEPAKVTLRIVDNKTLVLNIVPTLTTIPTVQDVARAGFDVTNARVICLYFDEQVCNDIVWVGTYRVNEVGNWSTNVEELSTFESLENYPGWYVVEVYDESDVVMGKPVQLKKDGSFSWNFISGDAEAWINMAQPDSKTATFAPGYSGEADCTWPENGAYIYELAYWKKHNTPCVDKPKHDYTITAYLPEFCDEIINYKDSVRVRGDFDDWGEGVLMQPRVDENAKTYYYAQIPNLEYGSEYKIGCGLDSIWKVQIQYYGEGMPNNTLGDEYNVVLHYDTDGYMFLPCSMIATSDGLVYKKGRGNSAIVASFIAPDDFSGNLTIPASVELNGTMCIVNEIGSRAFYGYNNLLSITIPSSVTMIEDRAFFACSKLVYVRMESTTPPTPVFYDAVWGAWAGTHSSLIWSVPCSTKENYSIAWGIDKSRFVEEPGYKITVLSTVGGITKIEEGISCLNDVATISATPDYGYHFVQWTDSVTDNPRSFIVTQDTTFTAEFAINQYTLTAQSMDTVKGTVTGGGTFDYLSLLTITATANYGYRFLKWDDGNTANPRKLTLTQDTTFIAQFTPESYQVTVQNANPAMGSVLGSGSYPYLSTQTISATANYGYHFNQWNDSVTDNPRTIQVLGDTIFTAEFAKNQYLISVEAEHGEANGSGYYEYLSSAQISVTADEHYHFVKWSDENTSNPRTVSVTEDKTYTAIFALDQFTVSATATHGVVTGTGKYEYGKEITLTVVPDFCYEFAGWNDGNMDNPRQVTVLEDVQYFAQCKQLQVAQGSCGAGVYWTLDLQTGVLTISGNGAMDNYSSANQAPWYGYLSFTTFSSLIIEDGVTHIGNYAFYGCSGLVTLSLPNSVATIGHHAFAECQDLEKVAFGAGLQSIGDYAFYNDIRIEEMTCLASRTPDVSANTFGNVSHFAWVYVQSEYFHKYEVNMYWNVFVLKTIEAEPAVVQEDDVTVTPSTDNATIVWPSDDAAAEYSLVITKDGVVFCTLTFNAQGQLIGIAFAPSRDGELRTMSNAEMTVNGWSFTVTGLNPGSTYSYTVDVVDAQKQSIHQYTGSFTTTGGVVTSLPTLMSTSASGKILYNGHLYILRDNKLFTATGARVK